MNEPEARAYFNSLPRYMLAQKQAAILKEQGEEGLKKYLQGDKPALYYYNTDVPFFYGTLGLVFLAIAGLFLALGDSLLGALGTMGFGAVVIAGCRWLHKAEYAQRLEKLLAGAHGEIKAYECFSKAHPELEVYAEEHRKAATNEQRILIRDLYAGRINELKAENKALETSRIQALVTENTTIPRIITPGHSGNDGVQDRITVK